MHKKVMSSFCKIYDKHAKPGLFFAPGRVNLIGEYTDFNGGYVLPAALSIGTYLAIAKSGDDQLHFFSGNFEDDGIIKVEINGQYQKTGRWCDYCLGVLDEFQKLGHKLASGYYFYLEGNIPNGAGLSSSASVEVVMATALNHIFNAGLDRREIVLLARRAENQFIGVNCGIMDQFVIGFGKANHAIMLNTDTLDYDEVAMSLGDCEIVIINTNKKRGLAESKYNERVKECQTALESFQTKFDVAELCQIDESHIDRALSTIDDEIVKRRAEHVVREHYRVIAAKNALENGEMVTFGQLLNASHDSLRDNFEVTGIELDTLVAIANSHPDVLGARMTGAGFGGCAIALVKRNAIKAFKAYLTEAYQSKIGYPPSFYRVEIGDGAKKIEV